MKFKELKNLTKEDLLNKKVELKKELMRDYAQISSGTTPKSPGMIKQRRRTIARIEMLLNSKEEKNKQ